MNSNDPIVSHFVGRFVVQMPQSMKTAHRSARIRACEIAELPWPSSTDHNLARESLWKAHLQEIALKTPPRLEQKTMGEVRPLNGDARWTQAVSYFGDSMTNRRIFWDVLLDSGPHGVLITAKGRTELKERILMEEPIDIARAYHPHTPTTPLPKENVFFLEHGYIALPYLEQEEAYTRFEGHPLDVKFEITTTETHEVETSGPLERLAAALATNFAPGVSVDRIRGGRRTAAGLNGEEIVLKMTNDDKRSTLRFGWEYNGKVNSGTEPEIHIEMETKDGRLDEKLKLWDALLNSFKPVAK